MTDKSLLISLYYQILRIRRIEEKIVELYPEQEMRCPVHLCIGQEAIAAGVCQHLSPNDCMLSNHRAHGHYLAKGGDLKKFLAEIYGKETGCASGRGGSMHLIDLSVNFLGSTPIVGSSIPVATGVAFAEARKKRPSLTVIFLGDAAMEEGVFHESLNFAALKKLPLLFVCENNLYSVYTHLNDRQPSRPLADWARGHGVWAASSDGNDVMKVYETTAQAISEIKKGNGPAFVEFSTYRWREHCGPNYDNDIGYRTVEEFEKWKVHCPLEQFHQKLLSEKVLNTSEITQMETKIRREIEEAVEFARTSPFPRKSLTLADVYAN